MKRYSLDVKQAAARMGISPKSLYGLAERREIAHLRTRGTVAQRVIAGRAQTFTVSGRLKFAPEDCDAWIAAHVVEAAPERAIAAAPPSPALDPLPLPKQRRFAR